MIEVKFKRVHPNAVIPTIAKEGDAGADLTAVEMFIDEFGNTCYDTGLQMEIPYGYEGEIRPRSSITKYQCRLINSPATIDAGYRGNIILKFREDKSLAAKAHSPIFYSVGERIAQILIKPVPQVRFTEVSELSNSERGDGGYGSTGK
jgi:dUTP pyrophosphatase